jgi:hypothetical protein
VANHSTADAGQRQVCHPRKRGKKHLFFNICQGRGMAPRNFPERNNPERNLPERKNPKQFSGIYVKIPKGC